MLKLLPVDELRLEVAKGFFFLFVFFGFGALKLNTYMSERKETELPDICE